MTGCRYSASSHRLVDSTRIPARCRERSSFGWESRLAPASPSASRTRRPASSSFAGRAARRRPLAEHVREDRVVRRGVPRKARGAQFRGDERSRRLGGGQQPQAARIGRCRRSPRAAGRTRRMALVEAIRAVRPAIDARVDPARTALAPPRPARRCGRGVPLRRARGRSRRRVTSAESRRIAWHSRRSWQRAMRTPAASSAAYQRGVSLQTQRGARPPRSRRPKPRAHRPRIVRRSRSAPSASRIAAATPSSARPRTIQVARSALSTVEVPAEALRRSIDSFAAASARLLEAAAPTRT